jgi:hypothetical protein
VLITLDLLLVLVGLIDVIVLSKEMSHSSIGILLMLLLELLVVENLMLSSVSISIVRVEVIV